MILAQLSIINIITIIVLAIVVLVFLKYSFMTFKEKPRQPFSWADASDNGTLGADLVKVEKVYSDKVRLYNWWLQIDRLKKEKIPGDFAELGVYKGDSAAIIAYMDEGRKFHLFDTFEGFPEKDLASETGEAATYTPQHFGDTSMEKVKKFLGNSVNFIFHTGYFPESAAKLPDINFALVNMDADLYMPTKAGLEYFYPRMSPGGVIFIHDYNPRWPGIIKAIDEFAKKIPEPIVLVPDIDGTAMIIKSK